MCCLEDNVSRNCQTNTVARSVQSRSALRSLDARRRHAKKVGNVYFLCLVQVTRIYVTVEETLLGFVLASKRVPRCKEEAVLYKRVDRFGAKWYNLIVRSVQTHKSL